ncbi:hydrocephalus-inducing protein homolog [Melanerpes formicivorus]|uniref:hydrocephalus-inducing protein homolog n=1 Tax=Melanerpes formicivorus TaxID=211600 RepID=UPI00358FDB30
MELRPGQTMEVMLEGFSSTPQAVREQLLCQAAVGSEARSTQILQVELSCQFIAPALQMSSTAITFQVEKQAGDVLTPLAQPLSLKNICPLPLSMVLALGQPFSLCDVEQQPLPADAQLWDVVTEVELPLQSCGKLPFPFVVLSPGTGTARSPLPAVPLVVPSTGSLGASQQQVLKVS